jgi:uncharacterized protein (DUF427 family)
MPRASWNGTVIADAGDDAVVIVDGSVNRDAAWYYPKTLRDAKHVEAFVAFWNGVAVERQTS